MRDRLPRRIRSRPVFAVELRDPNRWGDVDAPPRRGSSPLPWLIAIERLYNTVTRYELSTLQVILIDFDQDVEGMDTPHPVFAHLPWTARTDLGRTLLRVRGERISRARWRQPTGGSIGIGDSAGAGRHVRRRVGIRRAADRWSDPHPFPDLDPTMSAPDPLRAILDTLLDVHRRAFELRQHEVLFHALSSAAHAAEGLRDMAMLAEVQRLARESLAWIDAHDPAHRLSTASSKARGHPSIFEQLAVTTRGMSQRIAADRRLEELRSSA